MTDTTCFEIVHWVEAFGAKELSAQELYDRLETVGRRDVKHHWFHDMHRDIALSLADYLKVHTLVH